VAALAVALVGLLVVLRRRTRVEPSGDALGRLRRRVEALGARYAALAAECAALAAEAGASSGEPVASETATSPGGAAPEVRRGAEPRRAPRVPPSRSPREPRPVKDPSGPAPPAPGVPVPVGPGT
jgi:hypothetical protein